MDSAIAVDSDINDERRLAARLIGLAYLLALVLSCFAEFGVMGEIAGPDAAQTAQNITSLSGLFRLGTAANIATCLVDGVLLVSLYIVLGPVSRLWALIALFWGVVETTVLLLAISNDLLALKLLSGTAFLNAIPPSNLQVWSRMAVWVHGMLYSVALVVAGGRSTLFGWLWWRSRLIPRALAGLGIAASVFLFVCTFGTIISPGIGRVVPVAFYGGPIFMFELLAGLWLSFRGVRSRLGAAEA